MDAAEKRAVDTSRRLRGATDPTVTASVRPRAYALRLRVPISATGARIGRLVWRSPHGADAMHRLIARACPGRSIVGSERVAQSAAAAPRSVSDHGQIDAFATTTRAPLFGGLSGIQSKFLNADIFMGMVAGGYAPVYRPKSFASVAPRPAAGPCNACSSSGRTEHPTSPTT